MSYVHVIPRTSNLTEIIQCDLKKHGLFWIAHYFTLELKFQSWMLKFNSWGFFLNYSAQGRHSECYNIK